MVITSLAAGLIGGGLYLLLRDGPDERDPFAASDIAGAAGTSSDADPSADPAVPTSDRLPGDSAASAEAEPGDEGSGSAGSLEDSSVAAPSPLPASSGLQPDDLPPPFIGPIDNPAARAALKAAREPSWNAPEPKAKKRSARTAPKPAIPHGTPQRLEVVLRGPLETSIVRVVGARLGRPLTQVATRALVWWVPVPNGLLRGDRLELLYSTRPDEEPVVEAIRFHSNKTGETHEAYRFHARGLRWPRLYLPDGRELEERLVHTPLVEYEQITSLLRDGRGHQGVDFKAPEGTPIRAPFAGTIKRADWNVRTNGYCLELVEDGGAGRRAYFLHLQEGTGVRKGARVERGQRLALSGNSGRSSAPHLHYQLMKGRKVLDPFVSHDTQRRALPASERERFERHIEQQRALLAPAVSSVSR